MNLLRDINQKIIDVWADELAALLGHDANSLRVDYLRLLSFPIETVRIELPDGSSVTFNYSFAIISEPKNAVAVFTEHCGYHVFQLCDTKVFRDDSVIYVSPTAKSEGQH